MPSYTYTARDQKGSVQIGHLDAVDEDEVVAVLQHRGLIVTAISQKAQAQTAKGSKAKPSFRSYRRRMHGSVKTSDHVTLCQQLATLVDAGVPLIRSLEVVSKQVESRKLLMALDHVRHDVEAGSSFKDALARHPQVFSKMWINLVGTGEASGHLSETLLQLAHHYEAAQHLQNETRTALMYPAFLMLAAVFVLAVFVYFIIPNFTKTYTSMGIELPGITLFVMRVSDLAQRYWVVLILLAVCGGYLARWYAATEMGRWMLDRLVLKIPVFGDLAMSVQLAEFSRGLSTMLESGVPLVSSLEILETTATSKVYGQAVGWIKEAVKEGKPMATPMDESGLFPPMTVQMVTVGEEVGELGKMINRVARYYEEQVDIFIARMTKLFEPIAIMLMGGLVLVIVLSVFMPLFKITGMK